MLPLTRQEKQNAANKNFCYICKKEFDDNGDKKYCKVQDHCHYTGK